MDTCAGRSKVQPDTSCRGTHRRSAGRLHAGEQPGSEHRPAARRRRAGPHVQRQRFWPQHRPAAAGGDARLRPRHRGTASVDSLARNIDEPRTLVPVARPHSPARADRTSHRASAVADVPFAALPDDLYRPTESVDGAVRGHQRDRGRPSRSNDDSVERVLDLGIRNVLVAHGDLGRKG